MFATVIALVAACTGEIGTAAEEEVVTTGLPPGPGPLDSLTRQLGRLRARMRDRGYTREVALSRLFALEGEGLAVPIDLRTRGCTTFAALGGGGMRELRMTLYDREGDEVAVDAVPGEGGLVHVCPQERRTPTAPYYLVFEAIEGSGAIVLGAFESSAGQGGGFEGLFDGILAPRVPFREVEEHLARSRTALRSRGLLPVGEPALDVVAEGEVLRRSFALETGRCYAAVARGGAGVADADLFLFDPAGAEVARDLANDAEARIEHCPEVSGQFTFEARVFAGAGALGLMMLHGPGRDAPGAIAGAEPAEQPPPVGEEQPVVALTSVVGGLRDRGYGAPLFLVRDGTIAPGETRTQDVLVGPGCGIVVGAAGPSGVDLDLYLTDESGRAIDRDTGVQPTARVIACPLQVGVLRVTVKAYGREGSYALATLRAPEGIRSVQALRLEEATASLRARGYHPAGDVEAALDEGETFERAVDARRGRCVAFAIAGDEHVEDVDLFLRDASGALVASESGPAPYAAVSRCSSEDETLRFGVTMYRGSGSVLVRQLGGAP